MKTLFRNILIGSALATAPIANLAAQQAYFVDGFHGGVYGHYPLWNTQFFADKLAEHSEWQICLEIEPETWGVAKEKTPEAYQAFRKIAASRRVEFTNPTYAQPYMYNITGESIIHQLEYGMEMIRSHFPDVNFATYAVEEPCFTSCLPQILKSFGLRHAVLKCPDTCWGGYSAAHGGELVNWIGPDGTSILTVPRYECEALEKNTVWQTTAFGNSDEYLAACYSAGIKHPVGMCYQDAGWKYGPWIGSGNKIKNNSIYQTWRNYFENITDGKSDDNWHLSQEDVLPALMWGSQVLQKLARQVRASENNIIMAEKVNAMNYMAEGKAVNDSLWHNAWRTLFLSQHHDSWIVPYNGLFPGKTWAEAIDGWTKNTDRIANNIIRTSVGGGSNNPQMIKVINTTATAREEPVEVKLPLEFSWKNFTLTNDAGKGLPFSVSVKKGHATIQFMATVPSFGYAVYRIKEGGTSLPMGVSCKAYMGSEGKYVMENDVYRITFDLTRGGTISSLIAKQMGNKEFVDSASPFAFSELRGFFCDENKFRSNTEAPAKASVIEQTPFKVSVEMEGQIAGNPYTQIYTLEKGGKRIDCHLKIDWKGNPSIGEFKTEDTWATNKRPFYDSRYKLTLLFPAATGEQEVYKNAPFDVCKSRLDNTFFSTWDSIKNDVVLNWADFLGKDHKYGLAMLSDHTTSYTHGKDFPAGLTVQYSGKGLWGRDYPISGPSEISYALIPHTGMWDKSGLWTESVNRNEPLFVKTGAETQVEGKSFISINRLGYEISTAEAKHGALFIRFFNAESDDKPMQVTFGFVPKKIEEVQLDGKVIAPAELKKNSIRLAMPRFGLRTVKVSF